MLPALALYVSQAGCTTNNNTRTIFFRDGLDPGLPNLFQEVPIYQIEYMYSWACDFEAIGLRVLVTSPLSFCCLIDSCL